MKRMIARLRNKRGSQMAEAAIALPVAILAAMLMLRMFTFYLEILTGGIAEHKAAMRMQDEYRGAFIRTYTKEKKISLLKGGLLKTDVSKRLSIRAYMINEDILVRSGEILGQ